MMKTALKRLMILIIIFTLCIINRIDIQALEGDTLSEVIPDSTLRACIINNAYGKGFSDSTNIDDVSNYYTRTLACGTNNGYITDLTGVNHLKKVTILQLDGHRISDLTPLKNMSHLTKIDLSNNRMTDDVLTTLNGADLPNLLWLYLNNNQLTDISSIASFSSILDLSINNNNISDISPIENLQEITILSMNNNNIKDLSPLEGKEFLYLLYFGNNNVSSLEALRGTKIFGAIQFPNNKVSDLSPLEGNKNMYNIIATGNNITKISEDFYNIIKDIDYFSIFREQSVILPEVVVSNNSLTIENPITLNGQYLSLKSISNGGIQSADLSKITWNFLEPAPQNVTFQFSQILNDTNPNSFSGTVTIPLTEEVIVEFDSNGGTIIPSQQITIGDKIIKPIVPLKEGYIFDGWYTNTSYTTKWNFNQIILENMTLYASWKKEIIDIDPNNPEEINANKDNNFPNTNNSEVEDKGENHNLYINTNSPTISPKTGIKNSISIYEFLLLYSGSVMILLKTKRQ